MEATPNPGSKGGIRKRKDCHEGIGKELVRRMVSGPCPARFSFQKVFETPKYFKMKLTRKDEKLFLSAINSRDAGNLSESCEIFVELVRRNPKNAGLHWCLGHIYWKLGDLTQAVDTFRRATLLAPRSERASLGLFHCLWEQRKKTEALNEAKRFTAICPSKDYADIINELSSHRS